MKMTDPTLNNRMIYHSQWQVWRPSIRVLVQLVRRRQLNLSIR